MKPEDLDQRAKLRLWPGYGPAHTARSQDFATLREALAAAAVALERHEGQPWITTEAGDILSPRWIRAHVTGGH
ncbi:hypothetical protein [Methylobacterium symbioticum]|uniref:Uncharacterized protein n=1 Tax=Methylobacterium symbioticum TaxID=2584084 RepID=A0A509EMF2_9HYPH|nr:hypothetical protein [Methylobacterium symbioticum]VUD74595.1 hypothetical protein MET9862_05228 [Methylobacterium symbioticum]